jgi:NAD(P)-dependent dehydrogenase (short-subunit alcohol dehydrogenase family)
LRRSYWHCCFLGQRWHTADFAFGFITQSETLHDRQTRRQIAVVTGGTSGIGLATAKQFVAEGAFVFITGRRQAELDKAAAEIGSNAVPVRADSSNLGDLDRLYDLIRTEKGRIDILFASAGGGEFAPLGGITEEHYDKTFNTNVKGVLFTVQKALPLFRDGGSIILNASTAASKGTPAFSIYSATNTDLS